MQSHHPFRLTFDRERADDLKQDIKGLAIVSGIAAMLLMAAIAIFAFVLLVSTADAKVSDPRHPSLEQNSYSARSHKKHHVRQVSHRQVSHKHRSHHTSHAQRIVAGANGNQAPRLSPSTQSLVATINAKLARWVRPTGKCAGAREQLATFYWQGKRTATGEHFNPHGLTAASRHLPFGTRLSISNPHNGREVQVVINDRGPYTHAQIDLALGAANALGLKQSSYVCVR